MNITIAGRTYSDESELRARIMELHTEHAGAKLPESARDEWNKLNKLVAEFDARRARVRELATDSRYTESGGTHFSPGLTGQQSREAQSAALHTIERFANTGELSSRAADELDELLRERDTPTSLGARYIEAVASDDYKRAFGRMVGDSMTAHLKMTPDEINAVRAVNQVVEERAMVEGTGSAGGFAVPFALDPSIIRTGSGALNPVRDIATVTTITAARDWKGVSSDGVTATYAAEATEASDGSPTLAQPAISTAQWRVFVPISLELFDDWGSLQQEIAGLISDARDVNDASQFLTGNGSNAPGGILNIGGTGGLTATQRVLTAGTAGYAVADPWTLSAAIPARFRPNTTYAGAPATLDTTFRFVGGNSTEPYQFANGDRGGDFLGRPKVEWSTMGTGTTTGTKLLIGGDFATGYRIVDRIGMTVELIPHLFGGSGRPTGQRGIFAYGRTGAGVVAPNALRYLEVK